MLIGHGLDTTSSLVSSYYKIEPADYIVIKILLQCEIVPAL